jgi:hypothetical protein
MPYSGQMFEQFRAKDQRRASEDKQKKDLRLKTNIFCL